MVESGGFMGRISLSLLFSAIAIVTTFSFQNCSESVFTSGAPTTTAQTLRTLRPALAIRASGCVVCHAQVASPFMTDLGYGNFWFAGLNNPIRHDIANGTLTFKSGNIYGDHAENWSQGNLAGPVVVPKTQPVPIGSNGAMITLQQYFQSVESAKPNPASVREVNSLYIGAPTAAQLEAAFAASSNTSVKFMPNDASSAGFSGIQWQSAGYFSNTGPLVCDGDLFLRGTVFLNWPSVMTKSGCRIYSTGPIFLQGAPAYQNMGNPAADNNTNLQLVSARAILLGIGNSHCETASSTLKWYYNNNHPSPLQHRFRDLWTVNSHVTRQAFDPRAEGSFLIAEGQKLGAQLADASCYTGGRGVSVSRLLLNAPNVQSRFTGAFSGVVIAEVGLFSLNNFAYIFDPVFSRVPVLPRIDESRFLKVE